jgi:hypothetical protein
MRSHLAGPLLTILCVGDVDRVQCCMRARKRTISMFCLSSKEDNRMCILHVSFNTQVWHKQSSDETKIDI